MDTIDELKLEVLKARQDEDEAVYAVHSAEVVLEETEAYCFLSAARVDRTAAIERRAQVEAELREAALADFQERGEKKVSPGVNIRMRKEKRYDLEKATNWAREHSTGLLILDRKAFEKGGPFIAGAPIQIIEEPECTLASDPADFQMPREWLAQRNIRVEAKDEE